MSKYPKEIRAIFKQGYEIQVETFEELLKGMKANAETCFDGEDLQDIMTFVDDMQDLIDGFKKCVLPTLGDEE